MEGSLFQYIQALKKTDYYYKEHRVKIYWEEKDTESSLTYGIDQTNHALH